MQVLQLGAGVGVLFPVASVLGSGAALSGSELGVMGCILAGTVACGASMSWYCERFVGELSWRPAARAGPSPGESGALPVQAQPGEERAGGGNMEDSGIGL